MRRESRYPVERESDRLLRLPDYAVVPDGALEVTIAPATPIKVGMQAIGVQQRIAVRQNAEGWSVTSLGVFRGSPPASREPRSKYRARFLDTQDKVLFETQVGDGLYERFETWDVQGKLVYGRSGKNKAAREWFLTVPESTRAVEILGPNNEVMARVELFNITVPALPPAADVALPPAHIVHGPDDVTASRFEIVIMPERFTAEELPKFARICEEFVENLKRQPWWNVQHAAIRVSRLDPQSFTSGFGAIVPPNSRLLTFDVDGFYTHVTQRVSRFDVAVLLVNERQAAAVSFPGYNCVGSTIPETPTMPGKNPDWFEYLLHEIAHVGFNLQDEYDYYEHSNGQSEPPYYASRSSDIPSPNVTDDPRSERLKWRDLANLSAKSRIGSKNADCDECQKSWQEPHPIGMYEGGMSYRSGVFRPAFTCRMRELHQPFCRVCAQAIHNTLRPFHGGPRLAAEVSEIGFGRLLKSQPWTLTFAISSIGVGAVHNIRFRFEGLSSSPPSGAFRAELEGASEVVEAGDWRLVHVTAGPVDNPGHYDERLIIEADDVTSLEIPLCVCVRDFSQL